MCAGVYRSPCSAVTFAAIIVIYSALLDVIHDVVLTRVTRAPLGLFCATLMLLLWAAVAQEEARFSDSRRVRGSVGAPPTTC